MSSSIMNKKLMKAILLVALVVLGISLGVVALNKVREQRQPAKPEEPGVPIDQKKVERIRQEIAWSATQKTGDWPIYETSGFKVEYAPRAMIFFVTILKGPFEDNKKIAQDWFMKKDLNRNELCEMRIIFIAGKEVKTDLTKADIAPSGCAPVTDFSPGTAN